MKFLMLVAIFLSVVNICYAESVFYTGTHYQKGGRLKIIEGLTLGQFIKNRGGVQPMEYEFANKRGQLIPTAIVWRNKERITFIFGKDGLDAWRYVLKGGDSIEIGIWGSLISPEEFKKEELKFPPVFFKKTKVFKSN